jgi:hypothetical protein
VARQRERDRDRRVDVSAGEVAGGVDHDHDHEAEDEADPESAEGPVVALVGDDRAATGEDEREGSQAFGAGPAGQV